MTARLRLLPIHAGAACWLLTGIFAPAPALAAPEIGGEQQVWRAVTLDFEGPQSSETATPNPFTDYRFDVTFSQGDASFTVPGYFAACGDAAVSSCEQGNVWRVHFTPDRAGEWRYLVRFRQGEAIILGGEGRSVAGIDGESGSLSIAAMPANSADPRDRGRLQYNGTRYLTFAQSGEIFFKAGADAPENTLAFDDFDATPNRGGFRKSWAAHKQDAAGVDLGRYGWNGKGAGLLGAVNYLAGQEMNAVSFLTFSLGGDDQNVFPHRLRVSLADYEQLEPRAQWDEGVYKTRFDVSKLDQWQRIWDFADQRGMFIHFKLQELENDDFMDDGDTAIERTAYLRQIIARGAHYLALNWNNGEENTQYFEQEIAAIARIAELDPYQHHRVTHSYPGRKVRYFPLLGEQSLLTGISNQGKSPDFTEVRAEIAEWVLRSEASGKPWAIASDEQGGGQQGITVDADYPDDKLPLERGFPDKRQMERGHVLWGTLTAGGYGVEYYGGYGTGCGDLRCQDHRARASKWADAAAALRWWRKYVGRDAFEMMSMGLETGAEGPYWFGKPDASKFVIYAHDGKRIRERGMAQKSRYRVSWFDPTTGELAGSDERDTQARNDKTPLYDVLDTGPAPGDPGRDWVLLLERIGPTPAGAAAKPAWVDEQFKYGLNATLWKQHFKPAQFVSEDQLLIGRRLDPGHGATLRTFVPKHRDVMFEFDARYSGDARWGAVIGDPDAKDMVHAGHNVRINVNPADIHFSDDRMGQFNLAYRQLPAAERDKKIAGTKQIITPAKPLNDGQWHHYRIETRGEIGRLFIDGELVKEFASPGFAHDGKQRYGFNIGHGQAEFDNVLIAPL